MDRESPKLKILDLEAYMVTVSPRPALVKI